ncbi:MAG: hypothetical protein WEB06_20620 [Actinomycetota bacterium]
MGAPRPSLLRRLIDRALRNVVLSAALLLIGWGVTALPGEALESGAILGAVGALFAFAAVVAFVLGVVGIIMKRFQRGT